MQNSVLSIPPRTITFALQSQNISNNVKREKKKSTPPEIGINPNLRKLAGRSRLVDITLVPKLRIMKSDFRRRYIDMYNNVINYHDPELLYRFLTEFCTPNCQFIVRSDKGLPPPISHGIVDILRYITITAMQMPDHYQALTNVRIHVPFDQPGSRIICNLLFKGTELLELHHDQMKALFASQSLPSSDSSTSSSSDSSTNDFSANNDEGSIQSESSSKLPSELIKAFKSLQFLPSDHPREFIAEGTFTIYLDDANRVEKFRSQICQVSTNNVNHFK